MTRLRTSERFETIRPDKDIRDILWLLFDSIALYYLLPQMFSDFRFLRYPKTHFTFLYHG